MMSLYYYEYEDVSHGPFSVCAESDKEAVESAKKMADHQGKKLLIVYIESDTENGTPFRIVYNIVEE